MVKKKLLVGFFMLTIVASILTVAFPVKTHAADDILTDMKIYNELVGFSRYCGVDGGGDTDLTKDDLKQIFDESAGDNGNAAHHGDASDADQGRSIVVGMQAAPSTNGMLGCADVVADVMTAVFASYGNKEPYNKVVGKLGDTDTAQKAFIDFLVADSPDKAAALVDKLVNQGDSSGDPFYGDNKADLKHDPWAPFVDGPLKQAINFYKDKISANKPSAAAITSLLLPALNYCFDWGNADPGGSGNSPGSAKLSKSGLYGFIPTNDYSLTRLYKVYNKDEYRKGDEGQGPAGRNDAQVGSLHLSYIGEPRYDDNDRWFTVGQSAQIIGLKSLVSSSNAESGLLSCVDLAQNKDIFLDNLESDGKDGVKLTDAAQAISDGVGIVQPPAPDDDTTGANPSISCENKIGLLDFINPFKIGSNIGKGLNWIICNIIRAVNGAINFLDSLIISQLEFDSARLEKDSPGYYKAWSSMRYVSVGLLLLIGLVMVISQMIGVGIFDAYTIKKVLPRMLAAAILITLSWFLCKLAIETFNIIGSSIRELLYAPFGGSQAISKVLSDAANSASGADQATAGAAFAGAAVGGYFLVATTNWVVILTFALPALLAVLIGFFFIVMRQVVIIFMVMTAPLAIVAFILPGTNKVWKMWHENFSKALIMYPLIVAFLSIGRVVSSIMVDGNGSTTPDNPINAIIAILVYFGPYFLIPATFKLAGGFLATATGAINDRSRGLLDRNRKLRQAQQKKTWDKTMAGNRFKGGNEENRRGTFNRGLQGIGMVATGRAGLNPAKMRRELQRSVGSAARIEQQELQQNNQDVKDAMVDDNIARAVLRGGNETQIRDYLRSTRRFAEGKELEDAVSLAKRAQAAGSSKAVKSAMAVGLAGSKTGFETHSDMYSAIIAAAEGDTALERALLADTKKASEGVRPDLAAPGYTNQWDSLQNVKGAMGTDAEESTNRAVNTEMRQQALRQVGAHAMLAGKPSQTVQTEMTQLGLDFNAAMAAGDVEQATELASQIASYRGAMGSASPEARSHVMSMLEAVGVDPGRMNQRTGQAVSTDEQLGEIVGNMAARTFTAGTGGVRTPTEQELQNIHQEATQHIRTRAGLYDTGGGNLTPEQMEARRQQGQPPDQT